MTRGSPNFAGGRRGVAALIEGHEGDTERCELLDECDQVSNIASEAIQSPYDEYIEAATAAVNQQAIERQSTVLRPADAVVDAVGCPIPRGDVAPVLRELVLGLLVERTDAGQNH